MNTEGDEDIDIPIVENFRNSCKFREWCFVINKLINLKIRQGCVNELSKLGTQTFLSIFLSEQINFFFCENSK